MARYVFITGGVVSSLGKGLASAALGALLAASAVALMAGTWLAPAQAEYLQEHRGGTMRLLARSAAGTLDPHINYTSQGWQMYQPIYDGLVTFRKAEGMDGFTVVADLAEAMPERPASPSSPG